jgi:hypothetical protein
LNLGFECGYSVKLLLLLEFGGLYNRVQERTWKTVKAGTYLVEPHREFLENLGEPLSGKQMIRKTVKILAPDFSRRRKDLFNLFPHFPGFTWRTVCVPLFFRHDPPVNFMTEELNFPPLPCPLVVSEALL